MMRCIRIFGFYASDELARFFYAEDRGDSRDKPGIQD
jgi:hypothetical protein